MKLKDFLNLSNFYEGSEVEQAKLLAFYFHATANVKEFDRDLLGNWFSLAKTTPNISRLFKNASSASWSRKGSKTGVIALHGKAITELEKTFPTVTSVEPEIDCIGEVLPKAQYQDVKRKYIKHIADQVNWGFESGAYDASAVMMRRLLEVLLIHCFRELKIESQITGSDGHYVELDKIIGIAVNIKSIGLTPGVAKDLKKCKDVGNLGAHDIVYTCHKSDIEDLRLQYRKVFAHLLHIANLF